MFVESGVGGAIQIAYENSGLEITLMNNNFDSNSAFSGGAICSSSMNGGNVTLQSNTFRNNTVSFGKKITKYQYLN